MSQRERSMFLVVCTVGGFVALGGAFLGGKALWDRLEEKNDQITRLGSEVQTGEIESLMFAKDEQRWQRWRAIGLPPDASTANNRYKGYLQDLARRNKLQIVSLGDSGARTTPARGGAMSALPFNLVAEGTLGQFITFMKEFYSINLPHQIREIMLTPTPQGAGAETRLSATIKIEALSLPTTPHRDFLPAVPNNTIMLGDVTAALSGMPTGLGMGLWSLGPMGLFGGENKLAGKQKPARDYAQLTHKNIFAGLAPRVATKPTAAKGEKDILKFVRLTDISMKEQTREAGLYNQRLNKQIRLRSEPGKDTFTVRDSADQVILNGRVKQIHSRDMIFVADGKHFAIHVGYTLFDALKKELNAEELKALAAARAEPET